MMTLPTASRITALRDALASYERLVGIQSQHINHSIVLPTLTRAFNQLEWDENLHPRGAGGKFVGGSGLSAEREAHHLAAAMRAFDERAAHASPEEVTEAKARMNWQGVRGYAAVQAHLAALRETAATEGAKLAQHPQDLLALNDLYQYYQRRLSQKPSRSDQRPGAEEKLSLKGNANARSRIHREMALIAQHMAHAGATPQRSYGISKDLIDQVETGIAKDAARPAPAPRAADLAEGRKGGGKVKPLVMKGGTVPADNLVTSDQLAAQQQKAQDPNGDDWLHQVLRTQEPDAVRSRLAVLGAQLARYQRLVGLG